MVEEPEQEERITLKEFLESVPPGCKATVSDLARGTVMANLPTLELYCSTESCEGIRFFAPEDSYYLELNKLSEDFWRFRCRNCGQSVKTFAMCAVLSEDKRTGGVFKLGEVPPFAPPTPVRLISMIGPEKEYFLKGRRAENQALGIAAFAYYRRVVENQKSRILDEIIKVSKRLSAPQELIDDLSAAKQETQFSKAVSSVRHGVPQVLLIDGHNPLSLLHKALSEGLHAQTDEQCLELATSIRVVMAELAEKLAQALKDEAELNVAVSRLLQTKPKK